MIAIPFDTLEYSHKLIKAGMPREQAEQIAEAQKEIFEAQNQNLQENLEKATATHLATKEDLRNVKEELSKKIDGLDKRTINLDNKIDLLRKEFEGKFNLLYWMIGFVLASSASIVFKLYF